MFVDGVSHPWDTVVVIFVSVTVGAWWNPVFEGCQRSRLSCCQRAPWTFRRLTGDTCVWFQCLRQMREDRAGLDIWHSCCGKRKNSTFSWIVTCVLCLFGIERPEEICWYASRSLRNQSCAAMEGPINRAFLTTWHPKTWRGAWIARHSLMPTTFWTSVTALYVTTGMNHARVISGVHISPLARQSVWRKCHMTRVCWCSSLGRTHEQQQWGEDKRVILFASLFNDHGWLVFLGHSGAEVHIRTPRFNYSTCDVKPVHQIFLSHVVGRISWNGPCKNFHWKWISPQRLGIHLLGSINRTERTLLLSLWLPHFPVNRGKHCDIDIVKS